MQHLLVTVSDTANLQNIKSSLLKRKGIERVQTIENDEQTTTPIEPDWKNRLHLPGPPLTDEQLEELLQDMEADTTPPIPAEQVFESIRQKLLDLQKAKA
jgi:hypothetical protein